MKLDAIEKRLDLAYEMRQDDLEPITPHLIGPPGVGKSTIVREHAQKKAKLLCKQFVDFDMLTPEDIERLTKEPDKYYVFADKRLTGLDPIDLSGLPRLVNGYQYVMFLPLALAKLLNKTAGLLFLDEFLNENRPNMLSASYKIVRDYKIGDIALNKQTLVVAASNGSEHSSISNSIPKPLRDRFDFIETEPPTVDSWAQWMDNRYGATKWERNILAYLLWKPSDFLANITDTVEDNGYEPPATPRGWSYVSLAFMKTQDTEMRASVAKGKLGRVGETLLAFLANKVPPFNELVAKPEVIRDFNIEQKYLAALTVAEAITTTTQNIQKAKKFMGFVAEKDDREFISALFAFLQKQHRRELFLAVKDNPEVLKALELTGKALL
ncbi:MAG: ATP-binding protein [Candidatus Bathyarchaeia archaeon]